MKKNKFIWLIMLVASIHAFSQSMNENPQDLKNYIDIRRKKFDDYSQSLQNRSGIFGNKTKKDLQKSHDALADIVETDNRIISLLNQKIDFKKFEKVNSNYNSLESAEQIRNLQVATDTLAKQVDILTASNKSLRSKSQFLKWTVYLLSILLIWMFFQKRKSKTTGDLD